MQAQIDIGFDQLVKLAKKLPAKQWIKLKNEVEHDQQDSNEELLALLLTAPTFSKKQLDEIAKTRKAINEWRTK